jgi:hypothetical protein
MARATWGLVGTTAIFAIAAGWLYVENRELRAQLAEKHEVASTTPTEKPAEARPTDPWTEPTHPTGSAKLSAGHAPALPEQKEESRLDRRQRRQQEFAAMFGRLDGETEDEYRARIVPLIKGGLLIPRQRVEDMRKQIEEQAHVTPEQSKKLDKAFDKVYADAIDYTNKAVADGQLSPYERNVSGWLEFAGGLGGILNDANGQIGQILSPDQMKSINGSGFEWGEYLGLEAPWENLKPPPAPKP